MNHTIPTGIQWWTDYYPPSTDDETKAKNDLPKATQLKWKRKDQTQIVLLHIQLSFFSCLINECS